MGKSKTNVEQLNTLPADLAALSGSLGGKQAALVSGVNIKTVNGNSLLGSGDLVIAGGGGGGGGGDVVGPASATDGAVALFDGATGKLLKVAGKGLSTEDYTTAEKSKLAGVAAGAQVNTVTSVAGKTGAVTLSKADVGLANADNTSDASKSVLSATKLTTARTLTIGSAGKSFDGSAALSWSLSEIGAAPTTTPTITGLREVRAALPANNIDLATGNVFTKTISATTTLTVSNVPAAGAVASFILELTNPGTNVTFWAGVKWPGGTAPTLTAAGVDVLGFFTHDGGTTWRGMVLAKDSK